MRALGPNNEQEIGHAMAGLVVPPNPAAAARR